MKTRISKLIQFFYAALPGFALGGRFKNAENFAEADSFLYGDGMGWTYITASLICDEKQELKPACCLE